MYKTSYLNLQMHVYLGVVCGRDRDPIYDVIKEQAKSLTFDLDFDFDLLTLTLSLRNFFPTFFSEIFFEKFNPNFGYLNFS